MRHGAATRRRLARDRPTKDDPTMARLLDQYNTTIAPDLADEVRP